MHEALIQLVGQTVGGGRFRLDAVLDRGGMGAVFRGVEVATGRPVAVKLMHAGLGEEPALVRRFQREAEIVARLAHPHVVQAIAAGGGDGGPPFIAMELVDGASLHQRGKAGEVFDAPRTVAIARQVLSALSACHAIGVVHRDLKPANVMLGEGPAGPVAKVVDFGVARLTAGEAMTRLTATGQVVGTAAFMAPEQAMGAAADARADVFSVGAVMHQMLAGTPPYGGGNYAKLVSRIVRDERERIHTKVPGLGPLGDVIERALAHDPDARYQSAEEMARALDSVDRAAQVTVVEWMPPVDFATLRISDPPRAEPPSTQPRPISSALPRRPPVLAAMVALVIAVGLGVGGTWLLLAPEAGPGDPVAERATPGWAGSVTPVAPVVPVTLAAPVEVAPAALSEVVDGAVGGVDAGAEAGDPSTTPAQRRRRSLPPGAGVEVRFSGGASARRGDLAFFRTAFDGLDFDRCWPSARPLPESDMGATFEVTVAADGRISAVRQMGRNIYPEFTRCMLGRLHGIDLGPAAGPQTSRLNFSFYASRR